MSMITERLVNKGQKLHMSEKHTNDSQLSLDERSYSKPKVTSEPIERTVNIVSPITEGSEVNPAHSNKPEKRAGTGIVLCEGETYASHIIDLIQDGHSSLDRICEIITHDPAFADQNSSRTEDFYQILEAVFELFAAKKKEFCHVVGENKDFTPVKSAKQLEMVAYMYKKGVAARIKDDRGLHEAFDRMTLREYIFRFLKIKADIEQDIARFQKRFGHP